MVWSFLIGCVLLAVSGNPAVLSKLLELGSPIDALDELGSTSLHYALQQSAEPSKT